MKTQSKSLNPIKRKKPFAALKESVRILTADGWTCQPVEQVIPHTFIKRDCFGFGDLLCCKPSGGIMLVQVTGDTKGNSNFNARLNKIKAEARAAIWLASAGRIQVHSWQAIKGEAKRQCKVFEVVKENQP